LIYKKEEPQIAQITQIMENDNRTYGIIEAAMEIHPIKRKNFLVGKAPYASS
jgi:hypothetical protein